jgi:hypothetical protein
LGRRAKIAFKASAAFIAAAATLVPGESRAALSDVAAASSQALEDQPSGTTTAKSSSSALGRQRGFFTLSFSSMFFGPAINNFDGHIPHSSGSGGTSGAQSSARNAHRPKKKSASPGDSTATTTADASSPTVTSPGANMRYQVAAGFRVTDSVQIGPVGEFTQKYYGPTSGDFHVADPQLRVILSDVLGASLGSSRLDTSVWTSAYYPVSKQSIAQHMVTALGLSLVPRLTFAHSGFSLSGILSNRIRVFQKPDSTGWIYPARLMGGIQANYRLSRVFHPFLMTYVNANAGPELPLGDSDLAADSATTTAKPGAIGLMPGVMVRPTHNITVAPRLNWVTRNPIQTTTVGVNASIQMI